jgi:hypothetical protein
VPESWLDADAPASSGEFVRSLHRGFVIIQAFGPSREELTPSEPELRAAALRIAGDLAAASVVQP